MEQEIQLNCNSSVFFILRRKKNKTNPYSVQSIDHVEWFQSLLYVYDNTIMLHHSMFDVSLRFQVHDYDEQAKTTNNNEEEKQ